MPGTLDRRIVRSCRFPWMLVLVLATFLMFVGPASATTFLPQDMGAMSKGSAEIVRANVLSVESRWNEDYSNIETDVYLAVSDTYKGRAAGNIVVTVPGGRVDDIVAHVVGAPRFSPGEDVLLFLAPGKSGGFRVFNLSMGKHDISVDSKGQVWVSNAKHSLETLMPKKAGDLDSSGRMSLQDFSRELNRSIAGEERGAQ